MTEPNVGVPPHGDAPLVITLCSTSVPMMLQLPLLSVFAGLTVFRSRAIEEGRERFRMHLGYFYDRVRAERTLVAARRFYPGAFLAAAPHAGMGSLDDTLNAAFQFAKGPATRLVVAARLPSAAEFESAVARATSDAGAAAHEPAYDDATGAEAAAFGDDMRAEHAFWAHAGEDARAEPEPLTLAETPTTAAPPPPPAAVTLDGPGAILDTAPTMHPEDAADTAADLGRSQPAARPRDRAGSSVQRYAVQLRWSLSAVDPHAIPQHSLFRQFTLYGVTVPRGEASEHGLRLGFFSSLYSAKQVADYVRHDFPHASVVPVSEREMVRAQQAAWNELLSSVGIGAQRAAADAAEPGGRRALRRDGGLRRLWGRQR
jgi:hypothetical protein